MKDGLFWRVMAVLALCVALAYVVSLHAAPRTVAAGGEGGYIMELVSDSAGNGRAYVLDTSRKVLMLYSPTQDRVGFSLMTARWIDIDSQAVVGKEQIPANPRGYPISEMKRISEITPR